MSFSYLPLEVIEAILIRGLHSPKDVANFSCTNKRFFKIANSNAVWKAMLMKSWPGLEEYLCGDLFVDIGVVNNVFNEKNNNEIDVWKSHYKSMFVFAKNICEMEFIHYGNYEIDDCYYFKMYELCKEVGEATLLTFLYYSLQTESITFKYYVQKVLLHFLPICLSKQWVSYLEETFNGESDKAHIGSFSYLLRGALLFEQWLCPFEVLNDTEISIFLSKCVEDVVQYISGTTGGHPCLSWNFSSDDYVEELSQCQEKSIINAITYVFCKKYKLNKNENEIPFYNLDNSCMHKVIKNRYGIPIVLCILFREVALRFGVVMDLVNYPNVMILRHRNKDITSPLFSYYLPSDGGVEMTFQELSCLPILNEKTSTHDVLKRMSNNILIVLRRQGEPDQQLTYIYLQHAILNSPADRRQLLISKITQPPENLNSEQEIIYPTPKLHSKFPGVLYSVGMIAHHRRFNYMCVIRGWDEVCKASKQWIMQMRVNELPNKDKQPFYHVLVSDGSDRYAAQESLEVINTEVDFNTEITHPNVGKYFSSYIPNQMGSKTQLPVLKSFYVPNNIVSHHYPDDASVTQELSHTGKLSTV